MKNSNSVTIFILLGNQSVLVMQYKRQRFKLINSRHNYKNDFFIVENKSL